MRAVSAFLNGAGSRRNLKGNSTDRGLLRLTDLLVARGRAPYVRPALGIRGLPGRRFRR
jgi:hypothetical protein